MLIITDRDHVPVVPDMMKFIEPDALDLFNLTFSFNVTQFLGFG